LTRAKQLLWRFSKAEQDFIWFTDEKNTQNDRVYALVNTPKRRIALHQNVCYENARRSAQA